MSEKLWPQPIEIIGLTGEFASGKTLFGLTIDPKNTLVFDTEKSSGTYEQSLGITRVDMPTYLREAFPNGHKPIQAFEWWLQQIRAIEPGKFTVGMLDTVQEIESGLADWVELHPEHFGHSKQQYAKMSGLMWGDVKEYWKSILSDLASRFQTFVFTSHMTNIWKGSEPTGKRKPKGKETLMELASLYLQMERKPDAQGNVAAKPAAVVLKSRLAHFRHNEKSGELETIPILPPRLPVATPFAIREYMAKPPDYSKLKPEEKAQEERMSDDERLQLQAQKSRDDAEAERLRLEREQLKRKPAEKLVLEPDTLIDKIAIAKSKWMASKNLGSKEEIAKEWESVLSPYKVKSAKDLNESQQQLLLHKLSVPVQTDATAREAVGAEKHEASTDPKTQSPKTAPPERNGTHDGPATEQQLIQIARHQERFMLSHARCTKTSASFKPEWLKFLSRWKVESAKKLTHAQANECILAMMPEQERLTEEQKNFF